MCPAKGLIDSIFNDISWYFPFCYSEYFKDYTELLPAREKDLQNSSRYCQIRSDANLEKFDNFCAKTRFKSLSEKPANQIMVVVGSKWGSILKNVDIWLYSFCFVFWRIVKKSLLKRDLTKTWIKNVKVKIYCWILTHYTEIGLNMYIELKNRQKFILKSKIQIRNNLKTP